MGQGSLVSVIVPVYNVEKYLARCLDSIVGQTYENLEIILVNDGSTDRSGEICRRYEQTDPRIRLLTQENQGLSAARNAGLDRMKGQYIVFVDSDDYISPCLVEILLDKLLEYDVPIAVCNYLKAADSDDTAALDTLPTDWTGLCKKMSRDEVFDTMGTDRNCRFVVAHCKMFDRKIFETLRYPVGKVYEDESTFCQVYVQTDHVCYVDLMLYAYRQSTNSITRKNGVRCVQAEDCTDALLEQVTFFQQYGVKEYEKRAKERLVSELISYSSSNLGDKKIKQSVKKVHQATGGKIFSFKWMLLRISPRLCRVLRKHYLKFKRLLCPVKRK